MQETGLEPIIISAPSESSEGGERAMIEYLRSNPLPEAVFGFLDNLAIGAARSILSTGARVPEDCWILGVGDTPEAADFKVPLSSLRVPVDEVIDQSWSWLLDRIADNSQATRTALIPMQVAERESTQGVDFTLPDPGS